MYKDVTQVLTLKLHESASSEKDSTSKKRMNDLREIIKERFCLIKMVRAATKLSTRHKDTLKPTPLGKHVGS